MQREYICGYFVDVNYNYMKLKHRVHFTGLD
jgi:hypothetical protein